MFQNRLVAVTLQPFDLLRPHFVNGPIQPRHHVVTVQHVYGLAGTGTAPNIPVTTVNADDLIVAMVAVEGPVEESYTDDTFRQWTTIARVGTTGGTLVSNKTVNGSYRAVGAAGTYTYAPTLGTSENWVAFLMAYKAS